MNEVALNPIQTLGLATFAILVGAVLVKKINWVARYNLPGPVLGGIVVAVCILILNTYLNTTVKLERAFQEPLMIAFFTTLGFSASYEHLKRGGSAVFKFLGLASVVLAIQVLLGVGVAEVLGVPALTGVLSSASALVGGPATTLAFAPQFESAGVANAASQGLAVAIGGILLGGLIGNPLATFLLQKKKLGRASSEGVAQKPNRSQIDQTMDPNELLSEPPLSELNQSYGADTGFKFNAGAFEYLVVLFGTMALGSVVSGWIQSTGVTLPVYIGAMIVASLLRNLNDKFNWLRWDDELMDQIGNLSLTFFIAMSVCGLNLLALKAAAFAVFVFLITQAILVALVSAFVVPKVMGDDYESIVMSTGFYGFMMGTTANALANMRELTKQFGPAPRAFLVVPLVGACFIDFINAAMITLCLNFLK